MLIRITTCPFVRVQRGSKDVCVGAAEAVTIDLRIIDNPHTLRREVVEPHAMLVLIPRVLVGLDVLLLDIDTISAGSSAATDFETSPQLCS